MRSLHLAMIFSLGMFPGALHAEEPMLLEAESGVTEIAPCLIMHTNACRQEHVDGITVSSEGTVLELGGAKFLVEWSGPGYYLESGALVQPLGEAKAGLQGQRWLEVRPRKGRTHTSNSWRDLDGDRLLSASDLLVMDTGHELRVKDVRLQLWVKPVAEGRSSAGDKRVPESP